MISPSVSRAEKSLDRTQRTESRTDQLQPVLTNDDSEEDITQMELIGDAHIKLWTDLVYEMFLTTQEAKSPQNYTLCLPQIIATLFLIGEVGPAVTNKAVRSALNPQGCTVLRIINNSIPDFLRDWDQQLAIEAKPNGFWTARRILVQRDHSKSYGFLTFALLKNLGVELKLASKDHEQELSQWLQRDLKLPETTNQPFTLWWEDANEQSEQNRRCPIIAFASHFRFQIPSALLDGNNVYGVRFQFTDKQADNVIACLVHSTTCRKIRFVTVEQCHLVEVPVVSEKLKVYVITNWDKFSVKTGSELGQLIKTLKAAPAKDQIRLFLPFFEEFQMASLNVAELFVRCIPDTDRSFQAGGFCDLGPEGAEASSSYSAKLVSNAQHFDYIEIMHTPQANAPNDIIYVHENKQSDIIVAHPFSIIVWDEKKNAPVYFRRVGDPIRANLSHDKASSRDRRESEQHEISKWDRFCSFFRKKNVAPPAKQNTNASRKPPKEIL